MSPRTLWLAPLCAPVLLASCAVPLPAGPAPTMFRPAFAIDGGALTHVVGAIDDGRQTAIAFDSPDFQATIFGPDAEPITYTRLGTYAMFPETYDSLTVESHGHRADLVHLVSATPRPAGPPPSSATAPTLTPGPTPTPETEMPPATAAASAPQVPAISARAQPAPVPTPPQAPGWSVQPGLKFRDQIAVWIKQANVGCGGAGNECYQLADPDPSAPSEPWRVTVADSFTGDFLDAMTWLRDGFWNTPRPDIEVTANNVIVLRAIGAPSE
jgi:hypothetical protein